MRKTDFEKMKCQNVQISAVRDSAQMSDTNLFQILTLVQFCQTQHNCRALILNLRKCDTSNHKPHTFISDPASRQECDTTKCVKHANVLNMRIARNKIMEQHHACIALHLPPMTNCFANTKCKIAQWRKQQFGNGNISKTARYDLRFNAAHVSARLETKTF